MINKIINQARGNAVKGAGAPLLTLAGLACGTWAAWHTFGVGAGLAALALSCWLFEWRITA